MIEIDKFHKSEPYSLKTFFFFAVLFTFYFLLAIKFSFLIASLLFIIPVFAVAGCFFFLKEPALGIALMIVATSLDFIGRITSNISAFHILVILTLAGLLLKKLHLNRLFFKKTNIELLLLLFLILIGISLFYSPNRLEGFVYWIRVMALSAVMYITLNVIESKRALVLIIIFTILTSFVLSSFAAYQLLTTATPTINNALYRFNLFQRFGTTFENPNYFATFLLLPLMIGSALLFYSKLSLGKRLVYFAIPLCIILIAFVGTFSRSAWVSLFFGIIFLLWFSEYRRILGIGLSIFSTLLVIVLYRTALFQSFLFRLTSIFKATTDASNLTRIFLIEGGIKMALDSYLIGVGFRGFPVIYRLLMPPSQVLDYVYESHTSPIEIFAELGIIGFFIFIMIFIRYFRFGLSSIKTTKDNFLRTCQMAFVGFILTLLINYLFSGGLLEDNLLWIVLGLTFATGQLSKSF